MKQTIDLKKVQISDDTQTFYGADQSWYEKKWHSISGCGPTTAALITMYMASAFPKSCAPLYPYALPAIKSDFIVHMNEVREFVKPGGMGLTSTTFFAERTIAFAQSKGVKLQSYIVHTNLNAQNAFGFLQEAVKEQYMPALLILKNPFKELSDFHWHWMAVTGFDADKQSVYVSTYGTEYELPFEKAWQQQRPYKAGIVYFYPA